MVVSENQLLDRASPAHVDAVLDTCDELKEDLLNQLASHKGVSRHQIEPVFFSDCEEVHVG